MNYYINKLKRSVTPFFPAGFIVFLLLFMSCEEEIDWETKSTDPYLSVEASIDDSLRRHVISLSKTADYYSQSKPEPIQGAIVTVTEGETVYQFTEDAPGTYRSTNPFAGIPGKEYRLDIQLQNELNGHSSFTATETMPIPLLVNEFIPLYIEFPMRTGQEDSFDEDLQAEEKIIALLIRGKEPEGTSFYRISAIISNQYARKAVTENYTKHYLANDDGRDGKDEIHFQLNEPINDGDSILVAIHAITRSENRYLSDLKEEIDRNDPLGMVNDPANVQGNISNGAIGCFRLSSAVYLADTISAAAKYHGN